MVNKMNVLIAICIIVSL